MLSEIEELKLALAKLDERLKILEARELRLRDWPKEWPTIRPPWQVEPYDTKPYNPYNITCGANE